MHSSPTPECGPGLGRAAPTRRRAPESDGRPRPRCSARTAHAPRRASDGHPASANRRHRRCGPCWTRRRACATAGHQHGNRSGGRPSSASGSSRALGFLERADRAVERGPCGPQLGEHVDPPRDRLGAQHERADALPGFDQAVVARTWSPSSAPEPSLSKANSSNDPPTGRLRLRSATAGRLVPRMPFGRFPLARIGSKLRLSVMRIRPRGTRRRIRSGLLLRVLRLANRRGDVAGLLCRRRDLALHEGHVSLGCAAG